MTNPTSAPGEQEPATLEERVTAALDTCDDILTALPRILERLEAVEKRSPAERGTEQRSDFRFETYPEPIDDAEAHELQQRADQAWRRLAEWVDWLVSTFRLASIVPPCWSAHPAVREELISLRLSWVEAWSDTASADAPVAWLERMERARGRLADGNWGVPRCDGTHDPSGIDLADIYRGWRQDKRRDATPVAAAVNGHGGDRR